MARSASRRPVGRTCRRRLRRVGQRGAAFSSQRPSTASSRASSSSSGVSAMRATALGSGSGSDRPSASPSSSTETRGSVCQGRPDRAPPRRAPGRPEPARRRPLRPRALRRAAAPGVRVDGQHRVAEHGPEHPVERRDVLLPVHQGQPREPVEPATCRGRRHREGLGERRQRRQAHRDPGVAQAAGPAPPRTPPGRRPAAAGRRPSSRQPLTRTRRSRATRRPGRGRPGSSPPHRASGRPRRAPARWRRARRAPPPS